MISKLFIFEVKKPTHVEDQNSQVLNNTVKTFGETLKLNDSKTLQYGVQGIFLRRFLNVVLKKCFVEFLSTVKFHLLMNESRFSGISCVVQFLSLRSVHSDVLIFGIFFCVCNNSCFFVFFQRHTSVCQASLSAPGNRSVFPSTSAVMVKMTAVMERMRPTVVSFGALIFTLNITNMYYW